MTTAADSHNKLRETLYEPETPASLSFSESIELDPAQLAENDQNNEISIQNDTDNLINHLIACQNVVDASYKLLKYVPDTVNSEQEKLWKEELLPIVLRVVNQHVIARSIMSHGFSAVRDLGIVIQKSSEIVRRTNGSPKAIEIAQKNIPAALAKLDVFIEKAEGLDVSALESFHSASDKLFKVIGEEAGNFVKQKNEIELQQRALYKAKYELHDEWLKTVGLANRYAHLFNATIKHLTDEQCANDATKLRILSLELMNHNDETKIEAIETKVLDSVTVKYRSKLSFRKKRKTTFYEMSQNPDRDAEKKYYESLILGRVARLDLHKNSQDSNQKKIAELTEACSEYRTNYDLARSLSEKLQEDMPRKLEEKRKEIEDTYKKLDELTEKQSEIEKKIGLTGSTLMDCLIYVKEYSRSIKEGTNAYAPFVSILNGVKSMVETDIELLSGDLRDIRVAGEQLCKCVGFLSKYNVRSHEVLMLSPEKHQLSIAQSEANVKQPLKGTTEQPEED